MPLPVLRWVVLPLPCHAGAHAPSRPRARARAMQAELQSDYVAEQSRYRTGDGDGADGADGGSGMDGDGVGMGVMVNEETTRLQVLLPPPTLARRHGCADPGRCVSPLLRSRYECRRRCSRWPSSPSTAASRRRASCSSRTGRRAGVPSAATHPTPATHPTTHRPNVTGSGVRKRSIGPPRASDGWLLAPRSFSRAALRYAFCRWAWGDLDPDGYVDGVVYDTLGVYLILVTFFVVSRRADVQVMLPPSCPLGVGTYPRRLLTVVCSLPPCPCRCAAPPRLPDGVGPPAGAAAGRAQRGRRAPPARRDGQNKRQIGPRSLIWPGMAERSLGLPWT